MKELQTYILRQINKEDPKKEKSNLEDQKEKRNERIKKKIYRLTQLKNINRKYNK